MPRPRHAAAVLLAGTGAALLLAALAVAPDAEARHKRRHHGGDAGAEAGPDAGHDASPDAHADAGDDPAPDGGPIELRCLYGREVDGHTGDVRCLGPDEVAAHGDVGAPVADAGAAASPPEPLRPTTVALSGVKFDGGEVPRAERVLQNLAKGELTRCASEHGGVGAAGRVEAQFLVRARGRIEGLELAPGKGVPAAIVACFTRSLERHAVGAPSSEPVGVTATFTLEPRAGR